MDRKNKNKNKNFNTKILSIVIAVFIWGFVSLFVNPEITRKYDNIPIVIQNVEMLKEKDLEMLTDLESEKVSITLKGKRTSIAKTDKGDITAYIDANVLKSGNKVYQVKYTLPYDDLQIASQNGGEIKIEVDKIIEKKVQVKLNKIGSNSNLRSCWLDNYSLTIKGISKNVKPVNHLEVDFDISNIKQSKKFQIGYKVVDKNGKELNVKPEDIGLASTVTVNVSIR